MPRVSPAVSLDSSVGSTLRGMRAIVAVVLKAGCSMHGSSKQTAVEPCTYDVFLQLFCVRPDVSENSWPSPALKASSTSRKKHQPREQPKNAAPCSHNRRIRSLATTTLSWPGFWRNTKAAAPTIPRIAGSNVLFTPRRM